MEGLLKMIQLDPLSAGATVAVVVVGALLGRRFRDRARKQAELQTFSAYREKVITLAQDVIELIAEAIALSKTDPARYPDFFRDRLRLETQMSGKIDLARLFFPNEEASGTKKGLRPAMLNRMMAALYAIEALDFSGPGHNWKRERIGDWLQWKKTAPPEGKRTPDDTQKWKLLSAFDHLSEEACREIKSKNAHWSCELALIAAKIGFVEEADRIVAPRLWQDLVESTINISRKEDREDQEQQAT